MPGGFTISDREPDPGSPFPLMEIPVMPTCTKKRPGPVFFPKPRPKIFSFSSGRIPVPAGIQLLFPFTGFSQETVAGTIVPEEGDLPADASEVYVHRQVPRRNTDNTGTLQYSLRFTGLLLVRNPGITGNKKLNPAPFLKYSYVINISSRICIANCIGISNNRWNDC